MSAACDTGIGRTEESVLLLKLISQLLCGQTMCSLTQTQTDLCTSGIGKVEDRVLLLKLIAQLTGDLLVATTPGTDITVAATLTRACTSGIAKVEDEITLLKIIAQNGCELTP